MRLLTGISELFSRHEGQSRKRQARTKARSARAAPHCRPVFEPLESRILLSVDLIGVPDWVDQGPGTILSGNNVEGITDRPQAGAVNSVVADPTDANRLFVASVNGGIWRTNNAQAANPTWTPLTDLYGVTATSDIEFSPLDPSYDTLFAGTGRYSSGGGAGTPPAGVLKTTDGGDTWMLVGESLAGRNIMQILPTAIGTPSTQVVLAATNGGLFRSTDGGETFGASAVLAGNITDLVADPGNSMRFYAARPGVGVYLSTDGGEHWNPDNGNIPAGIIAASDLVELAVYNGGGGNAVYSIFWDASANPTPPPNTVNTIDAFRSTNQGSTWTQLDTGFDIGRPRRTSIAADPNDANILYIAGTPGAATPPGSSRPSARIAMVDASQAPGSQWSWAVGTAANGTSPHPDNRYLAFDANGDLLDTNDGGIYRLDGTGTAGQTWVSVNGDLRTAEFYSVAYDELSHSSFGGTQDNGTPQQSINGLTAGQAPGSYTWTDRTGADGGVVAVDNDQVAHPGTTIHYQSEQFLGQFTFSRQVYDNTASFVSSAEITLLVNGAGGAGLRTKGADGKFTFDPTVQFIQPYVLDAVDPTRMLIGTDYLYESFDQGDNLVSLGGLMDLNSDGLNNDNDFSDPPTNSMPIIDEGDEFVPTNPIGTTFAMAYGGRQGGMDNADLIYVGTDGGTVNGTFGRLFLRTANTTGTLTDFSVLTAYGGGTPRDIALDPEDWATAYVIDGNNVYATYDAGVSWDPITENLGTVVPSPDLRSVELVRGASGNVLLVGTRLGVFRSEVGEIVTSHWTEYGTGLPNTLVRDLHYDAVDDVLLAGTWGRGAWTIPDASLTLFTPGQLQIDGDTDFAGENDAIRLVRQEANPLMLDVYLNGTSPTLSVEFAALDSVAVNGFGGSDTLTLDFGFGDVIPDSGIGYNGGFDVGASDLLVLENGAYDTVTYTATGPGVGSVDLDGDVVSYAFLDPVLDVTSATHRVFNDATGLGQTIEVEAAFFGLTRIDDGGTGGFESVTFTPPSSDLTLNANDGNDLIFVDFGSGTDLINVNGGAGDDTLQVNGTAADDSIAVSVIEVTRGSESVGYTQIEDLAVTGGAGDDDITVGSTGGAGARLDGEQGSDAYTVYLGSLFGTVLVNDTGALADTDTLLVHGTLFDDELVIAASSITHEAETVDYFGIEELTLDAGAGNDTITVNGTGAETLVLGGDGDDTFHVVANGNFTLTLDGQEGSDSYEIEIGALIGPVVINDTGTSGTDTLLVNGTPLDDTIILTDTTITGLGGGMPFNVSFAGIEVLAVDAKAGDDLVDGSALTLSLTAYGGDGDDTLIGGSNDDHLYGQADNDDLIGNLGSDYLDGGAGSDGIVGDMGTIERELVSAGGLALLTTPGGKLEAYVERPGTIRRRVTLDDEEEGGDDTLVGGTGDDYLHGGAGDDDLSGDDGIDALFGDDGDDTLLGGADDDHLYGGAGDDDLDGGAGADIAYGGDGQDRLVADSSGDRLIDWFGNFNQFVTPGPGFGAPVIVRAPAPWAHDFLFALAADDGVVDFDAELGYVFPGSAAKANSGKGA